MIVSIRFFAGLRELAQTDSVELEVQGTLTGSLIREQLGNRYPTLIGLLERSRLAVNQEFTADTEVIPANSEVAFVPPVSGG